MRNNGIYSAYFRYLIAELLRFLLFYGEVNGIIVD